MSQRTYGRLWLQSGIWHLDVEPHARLWAKRVFGRIPRHAAGVITLTNNPATCRDLEWFLQRFPLEVEHGVALATGAGRHRDQIARLDAIIDKDYVPRRFDLAVPAREYQRRAADLYLARRSLLLADEVGLGKTAASICSFTDPATLPALVVCLAHLPRQWEREVNRFVPSLRTHIIAKGTPYELPRFMGRTPDVLITSYHKLGGWQQVLGQYCRSVVFDEAQELRRCDSIKYAAAKAVAHQVGYRLGLSATPCYNYGGEIFNVLEVLSPGQLGGRDEFLREWCEGREGKAALKDPDGFGAWLRESHLMLRRTRRDVARELAPLSRITHTIDCDEAALKAVEGRAGELARLILSEVTEQRGAKMHAAEEFSNILRQATGIAKAPYVAAFVRLLLENGEPVVLYGWHRACFARGTRVITLDGTTKAVEDVVVGDVLLGPDSRPRTVKSLTRGHGGMYTIVPNRGSSWVCSARHILSVRNAQGKIEEWTAEEFASRSVRWRRDRLLYRSGPVTFGASVPITEPYLIGYWLGDGAKRLSDLRVSSADPEIEAEMRSIAARHGLQINTWKSPGQGGLSACKQIAFSSGRVGPKTRNTLVRYLRSLGLDGQRRVPAACLTASIGDRVELLAGLIDSDGHVYRGNGRGSIEFTSSGIGLANDVLFLARSLGFAATFAGKRRGVGGYASPNTEYYAVTISGDVAELPMRIARKRPERRAGQKNVLNVGFDIWPAQEAEFFGFEVDGDHLFLLDDFTVVHNCYEIWEKQLREFHPAFYTGHESASAKDLAAQKFIDGNTNLIIVSLRSGAGLDGLQRRCRTAVFGEFDWSPGVHEQCVGRVYRDGQPDPVTAYFLMASHGADPLMAEVLGLKADQIEGIRGRQPGALVQRDDSESAVRRLAEQYLKKSRRAG